MCSYEKLLSRLGTEQPVFLLEYPAFGVDEGEPLESVEALATDMVLALQLVLAGLPRSKKKHTLESTFTLGGWSMGGIVATEMALQLERAGVAVRNVLLVDSPSPAGLDLSWAQERPASVLLQFAADIMDRWATATRRRAAKVGRAATATDPRLPARLTPRDWVPTRTGVRCACCASCRSAAACRHSSPSASSPPCSGSTVRTCARLPSTARAWRRSGRRPSDCTCCAPASRTSTYCATTLGRRSWTLAGRAAASRSRASCCTLYEGDHYALTDDG